MTRHSIGNSLLACVCLAVALTTTGSSSVSAQRTIDDVPYVAGGDQAQRLDLYLPAGRAFPTLIMVHGGGLVGEDKRDDSLPAVCATVARAGLACASVNYRLGPAAQWPAQPKDIAAAVAWVRHNIGALGGDSTALLLLGHSSGCLLASLLGTDAHYLTEQRLSASMLRGIVAMGCALSPVLPAIADSARLREVFTRGALSTFGSLEAYLDADPTAHVSADAPPFLVLIAESEQINPPILERARTFAARMSTVGRSAQVQVLPGRRHYTALSEMSKADDPTLALLLDFAKRSTGSP